MPLNIKDPITEGLAREVAAMTGESKTGAIRQALLERKRRLELATGGLARGDRMVSLLERNAWPRFPDGVRGTPLTKTEEEAILGLDRDGA